MFLVSQHRALPSSQSGQAQRPPLLVPTTTQPLGRPGKKTAPSALHLWRDFLDLRFHSVLAHRLFKRLGLHLVLGGQDGAPVRPVEHPDHVGRYRLVLHLLLLPSFIRISPDYISRSIYVRQPALSQPAPPVRPGALLATPPCGVPGRSIQTARCRKTRRPICGATGPHPPQICQCNCDAKPIDPLRVTTGPAADLATAWLWRPPPAFVAGYHPKGCIPTTQARAIHSLFGAASLKAPPV